MTIPDEYIHLARRLGRIVGKKIGFDIEEAESIALLKLCEIYPKKFQEDNMPNMRLYLYKAIYYSCLNEKKKRAYSFLEDLVREDDSRSWEEIYFGWNGEDTAASNADLGELLDRVLSRFPSVVPKQKIREEILSCPENVGQILRQYMPGKAYMMLFAQYLAQEGRKKVC